MIIEKRLNKYISDTGYCSRRVADRLIEQGHVTVNGKKAIIGAKVTDNDLILIKNKILGTKKERIYMALNKPEGITCTTDLRDKDNIIDFVNYHERIFPVGRLDKESSGLIFLTNDGDIVNQILRAGNKHEKEYIVSVNKPITDDFLRKLASGVKILKTKTLPCKVNKLNKYKFRIILTQGLNRQIRRMCETLGYEVVTLERIRIMNIELKGMNKGKWRFLDNSEMKQLKGMLKNSSKTQDASLTKKDYYDRKNYKNKKKRNRKK